MPTVSAPKITMTRRFGLAFLALLLAGAAGPAAVDAAGPDGLSRLDPRLRSLQLTYEEAQSARLRPEELRRLAAPMYPGALAPTAGGRIGVDCLIVADDRGVTELERIGITPRTRAGEVVTATVPLDDLVLLEDLPGIRLVEMSRPLRPLLDISRPLTRGDQVNGSLQPPFPPTGYTGRNVVVGVIDTGIDLTHGDFEDTLGNTRIESVWDQSNDSGTHPAGFGYGIEWLAPAINSGAATQIDDDGHGTHVIGIAAGDGSDTGNGQPAHQFVGLAPEATIIAVKTTFTTARVADAVAYIFNKAGPRDAVVNLSLGTQDGPHDGTSVFDTGLGGLVGPGRLIVAAAGNESNAGIHARLSVGAIGDSAVFTFQVPTYGPNGGTLNDFIVLDGWYEGTDNLSFRLESPNGRRTLETMVGQNTTRCLNTGGEGRVYVENAQSITTNDDREIYIELTDGTVNSVSCGTPKTGTWKIIAYRKSGSTGPGIIDFWVANALLGSSGAYPQFLNGVSNDYLVGSPASAPGVISVGAFLSKRVWVSQAGARQYVGITDADIGKIAGFSSPGPLRDGTLAPLLSAPGMGIASARSNSAPNNTTFTLVDGRHVINQGTSQASPHVAGVIALILERYPHETPENVRNRLSLTAVRDAFTGAMPNNVFGHGKLDAVAALGFDTPVYLSTFEALPGAGLIRLRWVTEGDDPFVGFHVSRGTTPDGPFTRLTDGPIGGGPEFTFLDDRLEPGRDYWYLLEAIELDGSVSRFGPLAARSGAPALTLMQNGPNPFSGTTTIRFGLPAADRVRLRVFDLGGRLVRTLIDGTLPTGPGEAAWDGRDAAGEPAANGVYFYRLETPSGSETRKMILKR